MAHVGHGRILAKCAPGCKARRFLDSSAGKAGFAYGGSLWVVGREGGDARRLVVGDPGTASGPLFSPDGTQVAFTGNCDTNQDVNVVPAAGGEPRRLTTHPGTDVAVGWSPDGRWIASFSESPASMRCTCATKTASAPCGKSTSVRHRRLRLLHRGRQGHAGHRRHERRPLARLGQERQVSLLHRQHRPRPRFGRRQHERDGPSRDAGRLPRGAGERSAVAACARERRGKGRRERQGPGQEIRR
ncbi:MAG: PD40 domain-containing protein [Verrucomicrobia bacterium]|nr:PD40 domain-containing protein [Verrucomicrobiota bacterium]